MEFIETMLSTFQDFYINHILPELITRKIEKEMQCHAGTSVMLKSAKLYCYCQSVDDGEQDWIGCDAVGCKFEWFHMRCANVKRPPRGNWYCNDCKAKKRKQI